MLQIYNIELIFRISLSLTSCILFTCCLTFYKIQLIYWITHLTFTHNILPTYYIYTSLIELIQLYFYNLWSFSGLFLSILLIFQLIQFFKTGYYLFEYIKLQLLFHYSLIFFFLNLIIYLFYLFPLIYLYLFKINMFQSPFIEMYFETHITHYLSNLYFGFLIYIFFLISLQSILYFILYFTKVIKQTRKYLFILYLIFNLFWTITEFWSFCLVLLLFLIIIEVTFYIKILKSCYNNQSTN